MNSLRALFLLTAAAAPVLAQVTITTASPLPTGVLNTPYSIFFAATGGSPPYSWVFGTGSVPPGLSLNNLTGELSGTPTQTGTFVFEVNASTEVTGAGSKTFTLKINQRIAINFDFTLQGRVGVPFTATLTASGGENNGPYTWTLITPLPAGLTLNPANGAITGTPAGPPGSFSFTVTASDAATPPQTSPPTQIFIDILPAILAITTTSPLPAGVRTVPYMLNLTATGGVPPYVWDFAGGSLPPGLAITTGGVLMGTPVQAGVFSFTVVVGDNGYPATQTATRTFSLQVFEPLQITTTSPLPGGRQGDPYSQTLQASGGATPYAWSLSGGSLPAGLTLTAAGLIGGTPTASGAFSFTARVADASGQVQVRTFSLAVSPSLLTITTASPLPPGEAGAAYAQPLAAAGGTPPYSGWSVTGGSLAPGLSLNPANGAITGTPTSAGSFNFTVRVQDNASPTPQFASKVFDLQINRPTLVITTASPLTPGTAGAPLSQQFAATGGSGTYTWSITSGALPPGVTLNPATGIASGTPATAGAYSFTVRAVDTLGASASKPFTIAIQPPALTVTTASPLPSGETGAAYTQPLSASGGTPPYSGWSVTAGSLPPGLSLNSTNGTIAGTPTSAGSFNFTVRVQDSASPAPQFASKAFVVEINRPALIITTVSPLTPGTVGTPLSQQFSATGGGGTYTWSILSGSLPPGVTLNPATGIASGTPVTAGTYSFTVRAMDTFNASASKPFTIVIQPPALTITTNSPLPNGEPGGPYNLTFAATGGTPPHTWSVASGTLPAGLSLSSAGVLAGEITQGGQFSFAVRVRDAANQTATKDFSIVVTERKTPLEIGTASLPNGTVGVFYGVNVFARGGTTPYRFSITGLPPGVDSNPEGGIFGTPTRAGQYTVRVSATDTAQGQVSATFTITVGPGQVEITTAAVPEGTVDTAYSAAFGARGGVPPYTWSLAGGLLPPGLSVSAGGDLAGTPTQRGTFTFTIQVSDAEKQSGMKSFTLVVRTAALTITTPALPNGTVDFPYSSSLTATGGAKPYTWSLSGSVPPGLTVNAETGDISGTPTATGTFTFSAQAGDSDGQTSNKAYTITIAPALVITTASPLPSITVGTSGSASFAATGGTPPYTWAISGGSVPPGMSFSAGQLTGTPTNTGTFNFTVQVTDANKASTSKSFTLAVISGVTITSETLPGATAGTPYSASLSASGGLPPYRWSATGSLPPGVSVSEAGGISGSPAAPGTFSFTVQVRDSAEPEAATSSRSFTIVVSLPQLSSVTIAGVPDNPAPGQQPRITLNIGSAFPVDIAGTMTLTFTPDAANNADDPAIQFSTGGRTTTFTIPAGQTQAVFGASDLMIQTGTVAGTVTITTSLTAVGNPVTCACPLVRTLLVPRTTPVITSVRVTRTANGFNLVITGFSSTREMTRGVFRFSGTTALQTSEVIIPLTDVFNTYYRGNSQVGGQFMMTMPFIIQGEAGAVTSVSIILSNAQGDSQPSTASL